MRYHNMKYLIGKFFRHVDGKEYLYVAHKDPVIYYFEQYRLKNDYCLLFENQQEASMLCKTVVQFEYSVIISEEQANEISNS